MQELPSALAQQSPTRSGLATGPDMRFSGSPNIFDGYRFAVYGEVVDLTIGGGLDPDQGQIVGYGAVCSMWARAYMA